MSTQRKILKLKNLLTHKVLIDSLMNMKNLNSHKNNIEKKLN